jgi:hypothetical protein
VTTAAGFTTLCTAHSLYLAQMLAREAEFVNIERKPTPHTLAERLSPEVFPDVGKQPITVPGPAEWPERANYS